MQRLRYLTIALISVTLLGLELVWTRIFSAEYFYAFAFLTLSLAIMGLGLGALALRLFPRLNSEGSFGNLLTLAGLSALAGPPAVTALALDFSLLFSNLTMLVKFVLALGALSSTFFFGGVALAYLFRRNHQDIPRLYMADLLGAGVGVLVAIVVMNTFGTPAATFLTGVPILLAGIMNCRAGWKVIPALLIIVAMFLPSRAESLLEVDRQEPAPIIYKHWDAMAKLKMYDFGGYYRGLNIDNVANTPVLPFDGDYAALDTVDFGWEFPVKYLVGLFDSCTFLSLGSGGGGDVLQALDFQAKEIYAVEVIPQINNLLLYEDTCGYIDWPSEPEPASEPEPPDSSTVVGDSTQANEADSTVTGDSAASQEPEPPEPPTPVIRDSTGRIITCAEYTGHIYTHGGCPNFRQTLPKQV